MKTASRKKLIGLGLMAAVFSGISSQAAQAHRRDFPFTYDWKQPVKGEVELESHTTYEGDEDTFKQEIELEYGISDRLAIAPYIVFERERGGQLKYHEWKLESRYQLGKYKTGRILPGLYLEYARERGEDGAKGVSEIEGKLIFSRYDRSGGNLSLNLIAERALNSDEGKGWEKKYSFGYARDIGNNKYGTRGGFEWIHDLDSRRINAGPVLSFAPTASTWVSLGAALPLNKRSEGNKPQLRLLAEYEF